MGNLILGIAIAGIILCVLFILILSIRIPAAKMKADSFSWELLTYSPVFKKIIDKIVPPPDDKEFHTNERLISDSGTNISMRVLYFFKFALPIVILIICLSIYFINKNIYIDAIISDQLVETINVMGGSNVNTEKEETSKEKREREQAARSTYEIITHLVDTRLLKNQNSVEARLEIQQSLMQNEIAGRQDAAYIANEFYNKMLRVEKAKAINPVTMIMIIFISIIGFMVPNSVLMVMRFMRYQAFDNEVIALEMLTILVGSIESVTVKEVLKVLGDNSKIFKKNFEKALMEYPVDFEMALINLGESSKNKDFQALVSTLRQCATSDKYAALQTLQRRRISRKEYRKMMEEKKIESKMYIGLGLLMPVLFFLVKLLLTPWQNLMNTSGLF